MTGIQLTRTLKFGSVSIEAKMDPQDFYLTVSGNISWHDCSGKIKHSHTMKFCNFTKIHTGLCTTGDIEHVHRRAIIIVKVYKQLMEKG